MAATIVAGSLREAMAAAMDACCCGGSGSGSGSGVATKLACCDASPENLSITITGTTAHAGCTSFSTPLDTVSLPVCPITTGTNPTLCQILDCGIEPDDQNGVRCGPSAAAFGTFNVRAVCVDGIVTTTLTVTLCCVEPEDGDPEYPSRYRYAVYLQVDDTVTAKRAEWCSEEFDIASCDPYDVEVIDRAPLYDDFGGAVLNMVIT